MGLLDKVEKKESQVIKLDNSLPIPSQEIKKQIEKKIKKEETMKVDKPTIQLQNNKVVAMRPTGALEKLKEEIKKVETEEKKSEIDLFRIKAAIESKLKDGVRANARISKIRVPTGIPGLDEVMSGGLRKNSINLIAGGPGTGKTILAMQFIVHGIDNLNEPGVYISFEQTEQEILSDMETFGWDLSKKIKEKKLVILSYTPEHVEMVLQTGGGTIRDTINSINAKRVVIDSITAFSLLHEHAIIQRKASFQLFEAMKKWDCTAILISEQEESPDLHTPSVEEFEVDGVILLYNLRRGDIRERALEIFKMRATKHSAKIFPMTISDKGLMIYPDQTVF